VRELVRLGVRDVTLDEELLSFLSHGQRPDFYEEVRRVTEASNFLHLDEKGILWVSGEIEGPPRMIPPIGKRRTLVTEIHK
jgi:hypothetical protein